MATQLQPCSEYDSATHKCRSGHVRLHPTCRGLIVDAGCGFCGCTLNIPMCLLEDQPPHLIQEDGMPLLWRPNAEPATQEGESHD